MKKSLFISLLVLVAFSTCHSQTYSDNFDSYTSGTFITANSTLWTTWGNSPGSNEDTKINSVKSNSGSNSLYFNSSSATGGPQDGVLKFGGVYNLGHFNFSTSMFVESGNGGYINFQNSETPGVVWQMNASFINTGTVKFYGPGFNVEASYPTNEWFDLRFEGDLNTASWEVFINNTSVATYASTEENIATLNVYPANSEDVGGNDQSSFWMDDVSYTYTPDTLNTNLNGGLMAFDLGEGVIAGQTKSPKINFRNLGQTDISSVKIKFEYNGNDFTETFNLSSDLMTGEIESLTPIGNFTMAAGTHELKATILETNGSTDQDISDNVTILNLTSITPASGKLVIAEEGTGTWCGWCPRGTVAMERAAEEYSGFFQGIAVHNGDPMTNSVYDAGLGSLIDGYPSAVVDRGPDIDPGNIPTSFIEQIQLTPRATLVNGAEFDATTNELKVSITVNISENLNQNWKIACALVENNVTGTGSGYNQTNYYGTGTNGEMGGYESLPTTVPASQMVYNDVARLIAPSFNGFKGFTDVNTSGETKTFNFTFTLENDWKPEDIHIVGLFINANGKMDNGSTSTIAEAVAEGYVNGTEVIGVKELTFKPNDIQISPNPSSSFINISINESISEPVNYSIVNMLGQNITSGIIENNVLTTLEVSEYTKGLYLINFNTSKISGTQKLIIN